MGEKLKNICKNQVNPGKYLKPDQILKTHNP
jgi:hypothetical protein